MFTLINVCHCRLVLCVSPAAACGVDSLYPQLSLIWLNFNYRHILEDPHFNEQNLVCVTTAPIAPADHALEKET